MFIISWQLRSLLWNIFTHNVILILLITEAGLKISNNNKNNQNCTNYVSSYYKNNNQRIDISSIDDYDIQVIPTKPASNYQTSLIGIEIVVPNAG